MSTFVRGAKSSAATAAAPPRSRFASIVASQQRDPIIGEGVYTLRVDGIELRTHPVKRTDSYRITMRVVEAIDGSAHRAGDVVVVIMTSTVAGLADLKRFAIAAAGFGATLASYDAGEHEGMPLRAAAEAAEAAYDSADSECGYEGAILDAALGTTPRGVENHAPSLVGRHVSVVVSRGKDIPGPDGQPSGDYYRRYTWLAVPDDQQPGA